jgi:hypothetical protein
LYPVLPASAASTSISSIDRAGYRETSEETSPNGEYVTTSSGEEERSEAGLMERMKRESERSAMR